MEIVTNIKELNFHPSPEQNILIIYTGGTIGMRVDSEGVLVPFDFSQFVDLVPELSQFRYNFSICSFSPLIDSADMQPDHWIAIANIIRDNYTAFDGFIVLQGTDTMAYAASGVSFLLENIDKPVVFTGAQLPIGALRNDARNNLLSAIEIAGKKEEGKHLIQEIVIFFDDKLLRANRSRKVQATNLDAFQSENYPVLANTGVNIEFNIKRLYKPRGAKAFYHKLCKDVALIKLYPGMSPGLLKKVFSDKSLQGIVLETFGAGNATTNSRFLEVLKQFIDRGGVIVNISQCDGGEVMQERYQTGNKLESIGVISGVDMTSEAALAKLMFVLAHYGPNEYKVRLESSLRGELTE